MFVQGVGIKGADCGLKFHFFPLFSFFGVVLEIAEDYIYIYFTVTVRFQLRDSCKSLTSTAPVVELAQL